MLLAKCQSVGKTWHENCKLPSWRGHTCLCVSWRMVARSVQPQSLWFIFWTHTGIFYDLPHTHTHTCAVTATVKSSRCKQYLENVISCTLRCSAVIWQEFSLNRSLYHSLFMSCFSNMKHSVYERIKIWRAERLTQHILMCIMCERLVDAFTLPAVVLSVISRRCSLLAGCCCHDLFSMLA